MAQAFVDEPTLWPVLAVVLLTAATFVAALLVLAIEDRSVPAMGALAGVAFLGVEAVRTARTAGRMAVVGGLLVAVLSAGAVAAAAYLRLAS